MQSPQVCKDIVVSAPGKVILHGEHAVVYGKAAVAGSLDLRCHLRLHRSTDSILSLHLPDISISKQIDVRTLASTFREFIQKVPYEDPIPASDTVLSALKKFLDLETTDSDPKQLALIAFLYLYLSLFIEERDLPSLSIDISSKLPVGAGLGSSAAFSVSVAAALLQFAGAITSAKSTTGGEATWSQEDLEIINKWAFIGEKVIHGNPSGIDNSISTFGGAMRFQKGNITQLESIPTLSLMLVNTRVPRSTKTLVANFRHKYNAYQEVFDPVLDAIEAISRKAEQTLHSLNKDGDSIHYQTLGDLMDMNQHFLNLMGVGHDSLDKIISLVKEKNFHGKLTGAGGGGCAIVLLPEAEKGNDEENKRYISLLAEKFERLGYQVWSKISFGGKGVLLHS